MTPDDKLILAENLCRKQAESTFLYIAYTDDNVLMAAQNLYTMHAAQTTGIVSSFYTRYTKNRSKMFYALQNVWAYEVAVHTLDHNEGVDREIPALVDTYKVKSPFHAFGTLAAVVSSDLLSPSTTAIPKRVMMLLRAEVGRRIYHYGTNPDRHWGVLAPLIVKTSIDATSLAGLPSSMQCTTAYHDEQKLVESLNKRRIG